MTLLTVYILCLLFCTNFCDLLKFESAQRDIYLNSHKINAKYDIVVKNYGNSPEEVLEFIFNHQICSKIYFISATQDGSNTLLTKHASTNTSKYCYFRINLLEKIEPNSESTISLKIVFGRRLSPFPKETTQTEEQSFLFYDDFFIDTIYEVITQMTNIHIDKPQLLSISDDPMVKTSPNMIKIGPMVNAPPFSSKQFYLLFKYSAPLMVIDKMLSTYQISEWGMINICHDFWVHNEAAALKSGYSRFSDNQHDPHAAYGWEMQIPINSYNIYYRDALGNISTSAIERNGGSYQLTLEPRFPIFGGWKTYYYVSYIITPLNFLFKDKNHVNKRVFRFELLGAPMNEYIIDKAKIIVLLPEGAYDIDLKYQSIEFTSVRHTLQHSYLDFYGRPSLEFKLSNGCLEKNVEIEISYYFTDGTLLRKPLMVSFTIFVIMMSFQLIVSMKMPVLSSKKDEKINERDNLINEIHKRGQNLKKLCDSYMLAVRNFKIEKKIDHLNDILSKLSVKMDKENHLIGMDLKNIKDIYPQCNNQVCDFNIKHKERIELLFKYEEYSKKVVSGEMSRDEYVKICQPLENKVQETSETLDKIIQAL